MSKKTLGWEIFLIILTIFLGWSSVSSGSKPFDEIFKLEDTIQLQNPKNGPRGISAFKIGRDGRIWRVSSDRPDKTEVRIYSSKGEVLNVICKKDISPIKGYPYILFTDIAFDQNYQAYVIEAVSGNVAMFDSTGRFLKYFGSLRHYDRKNPNCMGGNSIKIDNEGNVYLGGSCYEEIDICPETRDFCLHKYDSKGKHVKSFFPFEKRLFELTSNPSGWVYFDFDQEGNIWCVHSMVYQIFKYSPEGKLLQKFPGKSSLYKPPTKLLSPKSQKAKQAWWSTWTSIYNILVLEPNLILLAFNTPSSWVLEIYDQNGNVVVPDIQTNYRPLWKDEEGFLYFFLPSHDEKKGSREYRIGKFSLNLSTEPKLGKQ